MSFRCACAAFAALLFLPLLAFAQDQETLPFPFVSQLRAETVGFQIKLTWRDSPEKVARYLVYRGQAEITAASLGGATLVGQVKPGAQYFLDTPPDQQGYFYGVFAQDSTGKIFSTPIPFRNKTFTATAVTTPATEEQAAAVISDIRAAPSATGDGIQVTFQSSSDRRDLLVFRSTAPIRSPEDLLRSTSATQLDPGTTSTVVAALPGVDYWFAVLDAGLYKVGSAPLAPGTNATTDPVQVPLGTGRVSLGPAAGLRRIHPLPSLDLTFGIQSGSELPGPPLPEAPPVKPVSAATEKAIAALLASLPEPQAKEMTPTVLPEDLTPSPDNEETLLQGIVKGTLLAGDMAGAQQQLRGFLDMRRTPEVRARAHYYLGQAYFFSGRPREALLEFLTADSVYYHQVDPWKDACFLQLEKEDK